MNGRWLDSLTIRCRLPPVSVSWFDDPARLGRWLFGVGVVGIVASLAVGISGWIVAGRAVDTVERTIAPVGGMVGDLADSIDASRVLFERTTEAVESIETASRSSVRTITSVSVLIEETADIAGSGVADSLEAALETLPGLISTGRVIDNTMSALSLFGVDYDPEMPLDESLADLEEALRPLPDQIRDQIGLLEDIEDDLDGIAGDGRELSAVLLETRLDMANAERVLRSASRNAATAAENVETIATEIGDYEVLARLIAVAAAVALLVGSLAPLLVGLHLSRAGHGPIWPTASRE